MLRTALASEGYEVLEAANGRDALAAITGQAPDLVLLDLSMPVMDGMTLLQQLRDKPLDHRPRVVVLTAYGSVPAAVKAVRLGAHDFLEKPVTPEDLRLSIAAVLEEPEPESVAEPDLGYSEVLQHVREDLFQGDFRHAEAMLMRAAELAGTDPVYFNLLGVLHEAEGRKDLAKKFYGRPTTSTRRRSRTCGGFTNFRPSGARRRRSRSATRSACSTRATA
jgi:CheY-like chemotaxis protein